MSSDFKSSSKVIWRGEHIPFEPPVLSIILPTYEEAANIELIVPKICKVLNEENLSGEIIVVDDNSCDGTADVARKLAKQYPVRVHVRKNERGLATAVMKGFELAKGDICLVMDADMSHPVEKIPDIVNPIAQGKCDATVGSRYVGAGGCENWPLIRRIVSKISGLLARGMTNISDPTSGFMAIKKSLLDTTRLDPVGWKIVLEVIVKANPRFLEIPIIFCDRQKGESKLGFKAQIDYLHHLWRLYCYKYPNIFQFIRFCLLGISGPVVDTIFLISLVELLSFDPRFAAILAFSAALSWNYILYRTWTFDLGRTRKIFHSYISFVIICLMGLGLRLGVMHLLIEYAGMGKRPWYILASILGIIFATIFGFLGSRYIALSNVEGTSEACRSTKTSE